MNTADRDIKGHIVIVTGRNQIYNNNPNLFSGSYGGIGYETANALATKGATVILANRDQKKTEEAITRMRESSNNQNIHSIRLDLSDLNSVQEFVDVFKKKFDRLDMLILNAGVMMIRDRTVTK